MNEKSKSMDLQLSSKVNLKAGMSDDESLQASFRKFLEKRKHDIKQEKNNKTTVKSLNRTDEDKAKLRSVFIETAKKYIGIPYSLRYRPENEPIAPLYLDCCGLIRKILEDMEKLIGFKVGKWNQAYQLDTLPIIIDNVKDMKPGDLIFYEGIYKRPNARPQKHNIVHIEIFLGGETGEASLGSRISSNKVSLFDSYKFESANWTLTKYHYRSIETWLNGVCESCCEEHPWIHFISTKSGRKSIFYDSDDEDAETHHDINEPPHPPISHVVADRSNNNDDDDDEEEHVDDDDVYVDGHVDDSHTQRLHKASPSSSPIPTPNIVIQKPVTTSKTIVVSMLNNHLPPSSSSSTSTSSTSTLVHSKSIQLVPKNSTSATSTTISDGNPSKREKRISAARNSTTVPPPPSSSTSTTITVTSITSTTTNLNIQGKSSTVTIKDSSPTSSSLARQPRNHKSTTEGSNNTNNLCYYVNKANGWKLVHDALEKRGWTQLPFEVAAKSNKYNLKWVQQRSQIDYQTHVSGQLVNHIANNDVICSKLGLLLTLRDKFCKGSSSSNNYSLTSPNKDNNNNTSTMGSPKSKRLSSRNSTVTVTPSPPTATVTPSPPAAVASSPIGYNIPSRIPTPWLPETFEIDSQSDVTQALHLEMAELHRTNGKSGLIWLYKPSCNNRGRGIQVFSGKDKLQEICNGKTHKNPETGQTEVIPPRKGGIIQVYIQKPLLIYSDYGLENNNNNSNGLKKKLNGFKFDIRCYMLIARTSPYMVFYHPGYCRLTLKPYSLDLNTLDDPTIHLTNAAIQKQGSSYYDHKEFQIQLVSVVADLIDNSQTDEVEHEKKKASADYLRNQVDADIMKCMTDILKASTNRLLRKHGYFDLYGFDFMVTEDNKLVLIEINTNPAMSLDNSTLENLLPGIIDGTIELVLGLQGPGRPAPSADNTHSKERDRDVLKSLPGQFQLLYDEGNNYMYH